jgi:hypothetical protein
MQRAKYVKDISTIQFVIDYIYDNIILKNYRFVMLDSDADVNTLKDNWHYITYKPYDKCNNLSIDGKEGSDPLSSRCFVIFLKYLGDDCCFIVDKKTLKYKKRQVDMKKVKILSVKYRVSEEFYNGTFLDGYIFRKKDRSWCYHIYDIHLYAGDHLNQLSLEDKFKKFNGILKRSYRSDRNFEIFPMKLTELYSYTDIRKLFEVILPTLDIFNNGLIFLPKQSGYSYIYQFKRNCNINIFSKVVTKIHKSVRKPHINNVTQNLLKQVKTRWLTDPPSNSCKVTFKISKSDIFDVYYLSLRYKDRFEKVGLAMVQTMINSKRLLSWFNVKDSFLVDCEYDIKFKKWKPVSISDKIDSDLLEMFI